MDRPITRMVMTCAVLVAGMANGRAATTTKEVGSFFVATNGNDTNAGTLAMPFAKKGEERGRRKGSGTFSSTWVARVAARLGLQTTLRPRGRPRKTPEKGS